MVIVGTTLPESLWDSGRADEGASRVLLGAMPGLIIEFPGSSFIIERG